ncbi:hypothetical protein [Nocardia tenerifensis]|uniref:hypothetical protein n=1 Tax=Nocardia tenerifensis TaxID=228006 RepID=UPI0011B57B37|nr:hypothetical protein [Nocardia tenerifensis]
MVTRQELKAAVETALALSLSGRYSTLARPTDLYEAALFAIMLRAAEQAGGTVLVTNDGRTPTRDVRFRTGPGVLASGDEYTFAVVTFPPTSERCEQKLEVHLGIAFAGRSGICHECDIAILTHAEAKRVRTGKRKYPSARALIAAVEAKFLVRGPVLGDGRNLIGLGSELRLGKFRLVAPTNGSDALRTLLAHWACGFFEELIPGSAAALELEDEVHETIQDWLSRRRRRVVAAV